MSHAGHDHSHSPSRWANRKRIWWTFALAATYMFAELIGGILTNSLALLADAGHMLADVAALGLSLFAIWLAERPATSQRTYGYYRSEILAALANGATLIAIAIYIFIEAYQRFWDTPEVVGALMMWIASGGLLVNLAGLWILHGGQEESLNIRGAFLHVLTDALGSVGAILAGGLIWAFGWNLADPIISVVIGLLVIYSAYQLVAESVSVLMESAPRGIDVDDVYSALQNADGVQGIHDLHVWSITTGLDSLSVHVVVDDVEAARQSELLGRLRQMLLDRFGIAHVTIQIEPEDFEEHKTIV